METITVLGEELLSLEQTCDVLQIALPTLRSKYRKKEIGITKLGRRYYVPLKEVQRYLAGRKTYLNAEEKLSKPKEEE